MELIARGKVKNVYAIDDKRLEGKGLIRIPDKIFKTLRVKEGTPAKVEPTKP